MAVVRVQASGLPKSDAVIDFFLLAARLSTKECRSGATEDGNDYHRATGPTMCPHNRLELLEGFRENMCCVPEITTRLEGLTLDARVYVKRLTKNYFLPHYPR